MVVRRADRIRSPWNYEACRRQRPDGYIDVWDPGHPLARKDGYVFEHRRMAWDAGLLTDPALEVHHRNEVRHDNRLVNFEVLGGAEHARLHAEQNGVITNQFGTWPVKPVAERKSRTAVRKPPPCEYCGADLTGRRNSAKFCDKACARRARQGMPGVAVPR
jgi:hypothetical protein